MTEREEKWSVRFPPNESPIVYRGSEGGFRVFGLTRKQEIKDAHLIASAPALYEALKELNAELDAFWNDPTQFEARSHMSEVNKQLITMAQIKCAAALSQARGETGEEG